MRVIFAGTPEFARTALRELHDAGFEVPLVLTQPDRPAGRGMKLQASPVKQFALDQRIAVSQPRSLRLDGKFAQEAATARDAIGQARADAMVVAAYGLILPQWVLDQPRLGCLNIHASLLPRWRGAAPIHRAIEAGDADTGVTIMQMDAGLDTGPMLLVQRLAIAARETTGTLHDKLAALGARLVLVALRAAAEGRLQPVAQPQEGVTYAHKIEKAEAILDWTQAAGVLERRIRAFDPFPGAASTVAGESLKLWDAEIAAASAAGAPGTVLEVDAAGVMVACGEGALRLTQLQRAGGKRLPMADFLRGFRLQPGMVFGAPAA